MNEWTALYIPIGYLAGSIPFGLVLCYISGYGDIRKIGSGNIGATNVLRTGNKPLALLTLILDAGKGGFTALAVHYAAGFELALLAGTAAVIGHMFPVWLKFKGGKGVATTLGTYLAIIPFAGLAACATWAVMAATFRISSLSALTATVLTPVYAWYFYNDLAAMLCSILALLVWLRHRDNIHRLLRGEEPKIGKKKTETE